MLVVVEGGAGLHHQVVYVQDDHEPAQDRWQLVEHQEWHQKWVRDCLVRDQPAWDQWVHLLRVGWECRLERGGQAVPTPELQIRFRCHGSQDD